MSNPQAPSPSYAPDEEVFQLIRYTPVFASQWTVEVSTCIICRNPLEGPCMDCQANAEVTTWECPIRWGECQHCFHDHCIQRWLRTRQVCPLDAMEWRDKTEWNESYVVEAPAAPTAATGAV